MIQSFKGETLTVGNKELNLAVERGICKEEAGSNLIGEIVIFNIFVIVLKEVIPSDKKQYSYRLL